MGINERIASDITTNWQIKHNTLWDFESIEEDLVKVLDEKDLSHQKVVEGLQGEIERLSEIARLDVLELHGKLSELSSLADELAGALVITHDCATYRLGGECDGCQVSRVLTKYTSWKGGKKS